jgi:hypothetical protein
MNFREAFKEYRLTEEYLLMSRKNKENSMKATILTALALKAKLVRWMNFKLILMG